MPQQLGDFFGAAIKILTVGELTRNIRSLLEARIGNVWVQGEVSNYKLHPSGHHYFTLKDSRAAIACVIFRNAMVSLRQPLADGAQIQVYGSVTVFEVRGQYQLSVEIVQPRGLGLLQAKFEALKRKLDAEGLFDPARKKPLPKFPRRIGIITSPSGAAIRDMLNILRRRARAVEILINPVRVQGTGAAAEIAVAIRELAQMDVAQLCKLRAQVAKFRHVAASPALDVIVLARGGGSIEDLWEFNEEIVARAIAASPVPIVSAVGHEIDFTIADFVADLRAPTPSAAAELIAPDTAELEHRVLELGNCLERCLRNFIGREQARLRSYSERTLGRELLARFQEATQRLDWQRELLLRETQTALAESRERLGQAAAELRRHDPSREISFRRDRVGELMRRVRAGTASAVERARKSFERLEKLLVVLGPQATLERGYSITMDNNGRVIASVAKVAPGLRLRTRLRDGEFESKVIPTKVERPR